MHAYICLHYIIHLYTVSLHPSLHASIRQSVGPSLTPILTFLVNLSDCRFAWQAHAGARDCAPLQKRAKREGFVACPKTMAGMDRHGTFEEDLQRCIFRDRRSTKDMFMRDVRKISLHYIPLHSTTLLQSGWPASHYDL